MHKQFTFTSIFFLWKLISLLILLILIVNISNKDSKSSSSINDKDSIDIKDIISLDLGNNYIKVKNFKQKKIKILKRLHFTNQENS